jgi:hypothetical protein
MRRGGQQQAARGSGDGGGAVSLPDLRSTDRGDQALLAQLDYDRERLRTELSGWYFVMGPARIDCAEASKWRNRYCATAVSASLGPNALAAVVHR